MPKFNSRSCEEETRKGKCAARINVDISEQCVDAEQVHIDCNEDLNEECQAKTTNDESVDTRPFDEIMLDAFDTFNSSKSTKIRSNALTIVCSQLQQVHNPTFLTKNSGRLLDIIRSALDSNLPSEIDLAANIVSVAAIQLPDGNRTFQNFYKPLRAASTNDEYLNTTTRFAVFHAMGILTFLYEPDGYRISKIISEFSVIFAPKKTYANGVRINYKSQIAALETLTCLMTMLPTRRKCSNPIKPYFGAVHYVGDFVSFLESPCYDMRVACAKAIAVMLECGHERDRKSLEDYLTNIIQKVTAITTCWGKRTSDIKSTVEVLHYLENGTIPQRKLRAGKCNLSLDNWALNVQYELLCNVIGSANVAKHLAKNDNLLTKINAAQSTERPKFSPGLKEAASANPSYEPYQLLTTPPAPKNEYDFEKISMNLELACQKSPMERTKALEEICKELHLAPNSFLAEQKNAILNIIVKAMKRGNEAEQLAAVRLATLTVLQLGREERFCSEVSNLFMNSLKHSSASASTSASICTALAFIELVDDEHGSRVFYEPAMSLLRQLFSGTQTHDKTSKADNSDEISITLRTKALEAWALLLTLCSPEDVCSMVKSQTIRELTESMICGTTIEFRIACGQVIRLIVERGRIGDSNYLKSDIPDICVAIQDIINDRKNISNDKRKFQNASLREILKYLEDGCSTSFMLKFAEEVHELKTWSSVFKYQKLSQFIGSSLAIQLSENQRIRGIIPVDPKAAKILFELPPNMKYKLDSASKKKLKTKEHRLNGRTPKYDCL